MIDYLKFFFTPGHLFGLRPQAMELRAIIILITVFCLLIALGLASRFLINKTKDGLKIKAQRRFYHLGLTMGITGFVYLFFAWQGVALLGSRFWLLIWLIALAIWLAFIGKYWFLEMPKLRNDIEHKRKFEKYLP